MTPDEFRNFQRTPHYNTEITQLKAMSEALGFTKNRTLALAITFLWENFEAFDEFQRPLITKERKRTRTEIVLELMEHHNGETNSKRNRSRSD